jgi:hypothetical protein
LLDGVIVPLINAFLLGLARRSGFSGVQEKVFVVQCGQENALV